MSTAPGHPGTRLNPKLKTISMNQSIFIDPT
jgi:hypothetical protein